MNYLSVVYLFFFLPLTVLIYHIAKKKRKWLVLLLASYIFFFLISGKLLLFLLFTTASIYFFGKKLESIDTKCEEFFTKNIVEDKKKVKEQFKKKKKRILFIAIFLQVCILFVYKYLPFFTININNLLKLLNVSYEFKVLKLLAPIGVSFYTLEAISYLVDVYNKKIDADHKITRLALYLAFFPGIMEGPIARYSDTAEDLYEGKPLTFQNVCFGGQRILWGILKKFVVADRLNAFVKVVFDGPELLDGGLVLFGAICYTIMLYMEFSGTMDVIIGSGEIFGIKLPENFRQPFFSKTVSEFWTRWHITLGTWFKDYIFYPVSLSKKMKKLTIKARKKLGNHFGPLLAGSIALLSVWLLNGLWHGAGWNYIAFGLYHFTLILLGSIFEPMIRDLCAKLHINRNNIFYRLFEFIKLFILIVFGELIFRANGLAQALNMIKNIFTTFTFASFKNGRFLTFGVDKADFIIVIVSLLIVLVIGLLREKGIDIRKRIAEFNIVIRWTIYFALIMFIIIFGAYGPGYAPIDPIYANF